MLYVRNGFSAFWAVAEQIDMFKIPISFRIQQKTKTGTKIGKIFTVIIFLYFAYSFTTSDYIQKTNPKVLSQDVKLKSRSYFNLTRNELSFVIGITDAQKNFIVDEKIFRLTMTTYFINSNNQIFTENVPFKLCEPSDFAEPEVFSKLGLNGAFCLPDKIYDLLGYWDEPEIRYFEINLNFFQNSSENNFSCADNKTLVDFFTKDYKYLYFYVNDNNIDANSNNDYPFTQRLTTFYQLVDMNLIKRFNVYIKHTELTTVDGGFLQFSSSLSSFQIESTDFDVSTNYVDVQNIFSISFFSGKTKTVISRKYQDIQELFANITGIMNILMMLGIILSNLENNFNLTQRLTENLYTYQALGERKKKEASNNISSKIKFFDTSPKTSREVEKRENNKKPISAFERTSEQRPIPSKNIFFKEVEERSKSLDRNNLTPYPRGDRFLKRGAVLTTANLENFQKLKLKSRNLKFNLFDYMKLALKLKNFWLTNEEKLFIKGQKEIEGEMDIIEIMKKLQEIEKLKKIVLNKNELFLFDLLEKPLIYLEKDEVVGDLQLNFRKKSVMVNSAPKKNFKKSEIIENYTAVKNSDSCISKQILKLIDEDVFKFLGNEKLPI